MYRLALLCCFLPLASFAAEPTYALKVAEQTPPPEEVSAALRAVLSDTCLDLVDGEGPTLAEVWLRKQVPGDATEAQVKNGLTYEEVPESTLLAVVRFPAGATDYRKQRIPAGVYTLRLAHQPQVGDHAGTAPYTTFALALRAQDDTTPDLMEVEKMRKLSAKVPENHPSPWLLFPGGKDVAATPKLLDKGKGHWVLFWKQDVTVNDRNTSLGFGLTLVGISAAR
jgi:hypothetical protein